MSTAADIEPASNDATQDLQPVVKVPAFDLPNSTFLSGESREALAWYANCWDVLGQQTMSEPTREKELFYASALYQRLLEHYPVEIQAETFAGVYCEVFTAKEGVCEANADRALIQPARRRVRIRLADPQPPGIRAGGRFGQHQSDQRGLPPSA